MAKLTMTRGFTKGVSVDVLYLKINDFLEYNLPYVQSGSDTLEWHAQNVLLSNL